MHSPKRRSSKGLINKKYQSLRVCVSDLLRIFKKKCDPHYDFSRLRMYRSRCPRVFPTSGGRCVLVLIEGDNANPSSCIRCCEIRVPRGRCVLIEGDNVNPLRTRCFWQFQSHTQSHMVVNKHRSPCRDNPGWNHSFYALLMMPPTTPCFHKFKEK